MKSEKTIKLIKALEKVLSEFIEKESDSIINEPEAYDIFTANFSEQLMEHLFDNEDINLALHDYFYKDFVEGIKLSVEQAEAWEETKADLERIR